ncbi:MAG: HlyD family efflux transporter periplasmic adaptor subunit [Phycisphaerales bacterium]|nr:HlyD family efflux transporter periplasmic adaptor subunit [Phycisphaerales bacterium]
MRSRSQQCQVRGNAITTVLVVILVACLVVGWFFLSASDGASSENEGQETYTVERGDFTITIPASGELNAVRQVEVRNKLEDRAIITKIVPEGSYVRKGEVLLQIADEDIRDRIKDAQDKVKTGESSVVAAEQTLEIRQSAMQSDLDRATLDIELSQLAVQAWEEGDLVSQRQSLDLAIKTAEIDLARLESRFEQSEALVEKGFLSMDEYELDRIALIRGDAKLKEAKLAKEVYEAYQIKQDRAKLKSTVEQNIAEKARVKQRHEAEIVTLKADTESAKFRLQTSKERLDDLLVDLEECTILAPSDGLVVYASSLEGSGGWRGNNDDSPPQTGTELRPNELVMILPDTSQMIANLKVGEALSGRVSPGQPVVVYSDAKPDTPISGSVERVSVLAQGGGWRDPNRRDYTVRVLLDAEPSMGLKPSMRCRGEIKLEAVEAAISVPIQAVFRKGRAAYVHVPVTGGFAERQVQLGRASEMEVEITDGLDTGAVVLLRRPRPGEVVEVLPDVPAGGPPNSAGGPPAWTGKPSGGPPAEVSTKTSGRPSGSYPGGKPGGAESGRPGGAGSGRPGGSGSGRPAGVGPGKPAEESRGQDGSRGKPPSAAPASGK